MSKAAEAQTSSIHFTKSPEGHLRAHVIAKRTYRLPEGRAPEVAPEQRAIVDALIYEGDDEETPVAWEPDFVACGRIGTDVIVQGHAISREGPRREMDVSVGIEFGDDREKIVRRIRVFGDRKVHWYEGKIFFTEVEPFEKMPLSYTRAYGGKDLRANEKRPDPFARGMAKAADRPIEDFSPYEYPRNTMGRGYVVYEDRETLEGLLLPNLEMPGQLLTPDKLALGSAARWPAMPRPACFNFMHEDWFPRGAFIGVTPEYEGKAEDFPEVREGFLSASILEMDIFDHIGAAHAPRLFHSAPPWLIFPEFAGEEVLRAKNMHPTLAEVVAPIPKERPQMILEPHTGGTAELEPALRTVVLRPEEEELILVWVGTLPVDRPPTEVQIKKMRHAVRWRK